MTLSELRKAYPDKFYPQTWYAGEAFMEIPLPDSAPNSPPSDVAYRGKEPGEASLFHAVTLAQLYLDFPHHPVWRNYLWTFDTDSNGQRIYIGDTGKGLEIHRHLAITNNWGTPVWQ